MLRVVGLGTLLIKSLGFGIVWFLSIDHESNDAVFPVVTLDLTTDSDIEILWDILSSENLLAVHLGLPCGTASLVSERPVAAHLQAMGVPKPPPPRSTQHLLPNLCDFHPSKFHSANRFYRLAIEFLIFCSKRNIVVSVENPSNS